ncbi:hypothetical protein C2G38_346226 [Gigaspora rosea]|uniref:Uncharacterized protein n=1 Tax=Gigaspora rosea TaxID=44941 RepID=A0A397UHE9_9GLOM|nr:hypothetical protein C2G38_346226 [Gigaspora rosea]
MNKNNENVFSSRIEFEDENPIIIIHRVAGKKVPKKGRKNYSIQLSWIVIGYPTNFDFELDPQNYLTFQSRKFSILKEDDKFFVELPHQYAQNKCIFGTCSLEVQKNVICHNPQETTLVTGVYFVPSRRLARLFIYDLDNDISPLVNDQFLQGLMLNICIIDNEPSYFQNCHGQTNFNLNNMHNMQLKILPDIKKTKILSITLNDIIKFIKNNLDTNENSEEFKSPIFMSQFVEDYDSSCKNNGIINITPKSVLCVQLNPKPCKEFQISYFCVPLKSDKKLMSYIF